MLSKFQRISIGTYLLHKFLQDLHMFMEKFDNEKNKRYFTNTTLFSTLAINGFPDHLRF